MSSQTRSMLTFPHDLGAGDDLVLRDRSTVDGMYRLTVANIDRLRQWEPWAHGEQTRESSAAYAETTLAGYADGSQLPLALRHDGALIGSVGARIDDYLGVADIGYWVDAAHEGRGVVRRAVEAVIADLFENRSVVRIELRTATHNIRSRGLAERLGFQHEGTLRSALPVGPDRHDLAVYGLLAAD